LLLRASDRKYSRYREKSQERYKKVLPYSDAGRKILPGGGFISLPHQLEAFASGGPEMVRGKDDPLLSIGSDQGFDFILT